MVMGIPVYDFLAAGLPFPLFPLELDNKPIPDGTLRRFAGNARPSVRTLSSFLSGYACCRGGQCVGYSIGYVEIGSIMGYGQRCSQ